VATRLVNRIFTVSQHTVLVTVPHYVHMHAHVC